MTRKVVWVVEHRDRRFLCMESGVVEDKRTVDELIAAAVGKGFEAIYVDSFTIDRYLPHWKVQTMETQVKNVLAKDGVKVEEFEVEFRSRLTKYGELQ